MTLIMGLNLSDRIILTADTRVTFFDETGSIADQKDNILKILPLLDRAIYETGAITMAIAGSVSLATFIYDHLLPSIRTGELSSDIRILETQLKDYVDKIVVEWVDQGGTYEKCCFILAGVYEDRPKTIDKERMEKLLELHEFHKEEQKKIYPGLEKTISEDPIWQIIDKKFREAGRGGALDVLKESEVPVIKGSVLEALKKDGVVSDFPDSLLVSCTVDVRNRAIHIDKKEWGDFFAFGDQVREGSIPEDIMSALELMGGGQRNEEMLSASLLDNKILDFAEKNSILTIGGTVLISISGVHGMDQFTGKDLRFLDDGWYGLNLDGKIHPLIPFNKINGSANAEA